MPPLTPKQLSERMNYIGSSDSAAILGLSRYETPLSLWALKTGQIEAKDISEKLPVKLGHKLEQVVADLFEEATGKKLHKVNETIYHPKYPFLAANIDRRIVGEDSAVECKTVSAWRAREFENEEFPQEFLAQVFHQMLVTGKKSVWLAVLVGNQDFRYKEIVRDEKVISEMTKREVDFWNDFVIPKVMPMQISCKDSEVLYELFPIAAEESKVVLGDEANILAEDIEALGEDIKSLEGTVEQKKNLLKVMLGDNETGATSLYTITWKNRKSMRLDTKTIKEKEPEIWTKYSKPSETRVLAIKKTEDKNGKTE